MSYILFFQERSVYAISWSNFPLIARVFYQKVCVIVKVVIWLMWTKLFYWNGLITLNGILSAFYLVGLVIKLYFLCCMNVELECCCQRNDFTFQLLIDCWIRYNCWSRISNNWINWYLSFYCYSNGFMILLFSIHFFVIDIILFDWYLLTKWFNN